jgi:urease accessory protein
MPPDVTATTPSKAQNQSQGQGHLHLSTSGFTSTLSSYPLKLLTPKPLPSQPENLHIAYTLAYGGGLVAGDTVSLAIDIDDGCGLILLTQGSTKVYKRRNAIRPFGINDPKGDGTTRQRMNVNVGKGGMLLLLPDSVSPFRGSRYIQAQRFLLPEDGSGSIMILDWVNSGRGQQGGSNGKGKEGEDMEAEVWSMDSYGSTNEIWIGERRIMRERTLLDNIETVGSGSSTPVAARLSPYHVYATIFILGPQFLPLLKHLHHLADRERQFQTSRPAELIWSYSPVEDGRGGVLRAAGKEVEDIRIWLRELLDKGGVRTLVGDGLWSRVI